MRESCFRGKRTHCLDDKWVEGLLGEHQEWNGEKSAVIYNGEHTRDESGFGMGQEFGFRPKYSYVDPDTVGEFSGKRDKNERRIFEGDIVDGLFRFTTPVRAVCVFKDGAFGLKWTHGGVDRFAAFTSICNVKYEVVGNIYDNPELLEQEVQ